ncbi:MAG: hypothetical protein J4F37_01795 [Acidobacteria bacterium]|nr:hypothetical protein [Acidobacteriota bacterium]
MSDKLSTKKAPARRRSAPAGKRARSDAPPARRYVYAFGGGKADGDRTMRDRGKGANLAEMTRAGLPVPPGFTISTEACTVYYEQRRRVPASIDAEMDRNLAALEKLSGRKLGGLDPLLVSVRSGSKFSMPTSASTTAPSRG